MREYRIKCAIISKVNLVLGFIIYIFMRSDTYIHFLLPENLKISLYEISCKIPHNILLDFFRYYFVDFLWGLSLSFALCSVSLKVCKSNVLIISACSFVLGVVFEVAQYFSLINGTCDFADICMYAAASLACAAININILLRRKI